MGQASDAFFNLNFLVHFYQFREAKYNETLRNAKIYFGEFTKVTNISKSDISASCKFPGFPADLLKTNRTENDENKAENENNKADANAEDKSNDSDDSDEKDGKTSEGKDDKENAQNDEIDTSDDSDEKDGKENAASGKTDTSDANEYIGQNKGNQSETAANNNGTES